MTGYTHAEWSEEQRETTATVDGHEVTIAYWDSADGGSADTENEGPPVVFLHGIPTWSFLWRTVAPAVAEATDRRVVVPDLAGYGNSAMYDGFDRSVRAQEQVLVDLLDHLGTDRAALVAHDIGGGPALRLAAHDPGAVTRLVMSNAVCYDSWPVEFISDLGLPGTTDTPLDELEETLAGSFSAGVYDDEADPAFVEGMVAPWTDEAGRTSLARCAVATNTSHTTELDYDAVEADLLCLWGADDVFQPVEYGHRLAEDVGGEVVELEAYHWTPEDRPEEFIDETVAFLDGEGTG